MSGFVLKGVSVRVVGQGMLRGSCQGLGLEGNAEASSRLTEDNVQTVELDINAR